MGQGQHDVDACGATQALQSSVQMYKVHAPLLVADPMSSSIMTIDSVASAKSNLRLVSVSQI
jgi:hypothetical protein